MKPEYEIFGLTLKAYSTLACTAAIAGAVLAWRPLRRAGLSPLRVFALLLGMCTAFLIGARLWNIAISPGNYGRTLKWYTPRMAGLSLYGGILGAAVVLFGLLRAWRKSAWPVLDAFAAPSGIAFCIARIGCFLNGCCAGIPTDSPLGMVFPSKQHVIPLGLLSGFPLNRAVHPTQLYELVGALVGIPIAVLLAKRLRLRAGARFLIYGVWFCAVRLAVLPLRSLSYGQAVTKVFYPALYLGLIVLGVFLLLRRGRVADS